MDFVPLPGKSSGFFLPGWQTDSSRPRLEHGQNSHESSLHALQSEQQNPDCGAQDPDWALDLACAPNNKREHFN